jgi:hypothetical protein
MRLLYKNIPNREAPPPTKNEESVLLGQHIGRNPPLVRQHHLDPCRSPSRMALESLPRDVQLTLF